jgi:HEAT repeat protein
MNKDINPSDNQLEARQLLESYSANLKNDDYKVRQGSVQAMSQLGVIAVLPLTLALKDENIEVRKSTITSLGQIGNKEAIEAIINSLNNPSEDNTVRFFAAITLGQFPTEYVIETLTKTVKDKDSIVRQGATTALSNFNQDGILQILIQTLKDEDVFVRRNAVIGLGKSNNSLAVVPLINVIKDKNEADEVKQNAILSLGKLKDVRAITPLIEALKDSNNKISQAARDAMYMMGGITVTPLLNLLQDLNEDAVTRSYAIHILGNVSDERAIEPIRNALQDSDWRVRASAANVLGQIGNESITDSLIEGLKDVNNNVRYWAAYALSKIGDRRALDMLKQIQYSDKEVTDWGESISKMAAKAIKRIKLKRDNIS